MSLRYIIDGYNVVKHPLFFPPKNIKDDRLALLEVIRRDKLCGSLKNKIIVVFDGYSDAVHLKNTYSSIELIFALEDSADEKIKRMLDSGIDLKVTVVISDDREIKFYAKSAGAKSLGVDEFLNRKKNLGLNKENNLDAKVSYALMHQINQELRKKWLGS